MHIVIDCRFIRHSGIGRYIFEIVARLVKKSGYRFTLIVSPKETDERFIRLCTRDNVSFLSCAASMYSLREQVELPLRVPACDVFWSPHYNVPILPIRARRKIVTIHDVLHLAMGECLSFLKRCYARSFMYAAAHFYDAVLTDSCFSKREILRFEAIPPARIHVVYPGVDSLGLAVAGTPLSYALPARYILFVGNVKPHKNIVRMLDAYRLFCRMREDAPALLVLGRRDSFSAELDKSHIEEDFRERIHFTGYVEDAALAAIYRGAEAFVFPSLYEGFGLPPLEAMCAGVPVLASRAACIPEVLGDAALYFDPQSAEDMAEKLDLLMEDKALQEDLRRRGSQRVRRYTWDVAAEKVLALMMSEECYMRSVTI